MKKLRVIVLMHEDLVPPDSLDGYSDKEIESWATEYDVIAGLQKLGHEVYSVGVGSDPEVIKHAFEETKAHLAFNLLVHFHGVAVYDQHIVSYLELLKHHYTGCNPRGLMLARDKALSKRILSSHQVRVPAFHVFPKGRDTRRPEHLRFPLLVKSVNEEASLGISKASIVQSDAKLEERIQFMHQSFGVDVIVEEYIEGRELYVGVMGNQRVVSFPVWEMPFQEMPKGAPRIATARVKFDLEYQKKYGIKTRRAPGLSPKLTREIANVAKRCYRALSLTGYARMDLRLTGDDKIYLLEANPNPDLKYGEDFAESAHADGVGYADLLQRIVKLGISYDAEWKSSNFA